MCFCVHLACIWAMTAYTPRIEGHQEEFGLYRGLCRDDKIGRIPWRRVRECFRPQDFHAIKMALGIGEDCRLHAKTLVLYTKVLLRRIAQELEPGIHIEEGAGVRPWPM